MKLYRQVELREITAIRPNGYDLGDKIRITNIEDDIRLEPGIVISLKGEDSKWAVRWMGAARKRGPWRWDVGGIDTIGWGA